MEALRGRDEALRAQFLRSMRVRVYNTIEVIRIRRREPQAVGVGLVRVKPGIEERYTQTRTPLAPLEYALTPLNANGISSCSMVNECAAVACVHASSSAG